MENENTAGNKPRGVMRLMKILLATVAICLGLVAIIFLEKWIGLLLVVYGGKVLWDIFG